MQFTLQVLDPNHFQLHQSPASVDFEMHIHAQGPGEKKDVKGSSREGEVICP